MNTRLTDIDELNDLVVKLEKSLEEGVKERALKPGAEAPEDEPVLAWFWHLEEWVIARRKGDVWKAEWDFKEMAEEAVYFRFLPPSPRRRG